MQAKVLAALQASPMPAMPPPMPVAPSATGRGERPLGVTILAVLGAIAGLLALVSGLLVAVVGGAGSLAFLPIPGLAALGAALAALVGLVMIVVGLAFLAMAYGFWQGMPWAWTLALVLTFLGLLTALANMVGGQVGSGIVSVLIDVFLIWYYTREGVQRWFGKVGAWPAPQVNNILGSRTAK